jgi:L-alanine-DL-glutamate epimerase-like enolase superfamily enzyme
MSSYVEELRVTAYQIPADKPESDGTLEWKETTMVLVKVRCGDGEGVGYTYADAGVVRMIGSVLSEVVRGRDPMDVTAIQGAMIRKIRNNGWGGLAMMAVSAVDIALWDLKAKLLNLPLCRLLGQEQAGLRIYGSGGFTSYTDRELRDQLEGWVERGIGEVKIKVGRDPQADPHRVAVARDVIGQKPALYVDANGAYTVNEALEQARIFSGFGVNWLEEPVPAEFTDQLRFLREGLSATMRVVAGEYGYTLNDFRLLLEAGAVDVLQADATRCGGITGFLKAGQLSEAYRVPLSSHCAPALHLHPALSVAGFSIAEYFHDHVRIEDRLFEGVNEPREGRLFPDLSRPGLGLVLKEQEAEKYRVA